MRLTYTLSALLFLILIQIESKGKIHLDYAISIFILAAGAVIDIVEMIIDHLKARDGRLKSNKSRSHWFSKLSRLCKKIKKQEQAIEK